MATDKIEKAIKKELYDAIEQLEAIKREKWSID